jgi:hypothetical protein
MTHRPRALWRSWPSSLLVSELSRFSDLSAVKVVPQSGVLPVQWYLLLWTCSILGPCFKGLLQVGALGV